MHRRLREKEKNRIDEHIQEKSDLPDCFFLYMQKAGFLMTQLMFLIQVRRLFDDNGRIIFPSAA